MSTLYISDLDETLLHSDESISDYTSSIINRIVQEGKCFSYATARSIFTASKVTNGLKTEFPVICHNGVFIVCNRTNKLLLSNFFTPLEIEYISAVLNAHGIYPVVYSYTDGKQRFSYIESYATPAMSHFLNSRIGDPRRYEAENIDMLYSGNIFCFVCMDTEDSLAKINNIVSADNRFDCIYSKDIYSGAQWCEIQPVKATKANAALQLKAMLNCDKMVAFGDNRNDLSLFSVADEKYAVANAVPELKEIATAIIDSNNNDGVAKWLEKHLT